MFLFQPLQNTFRLSTTLVLLILSTATLISIMTATAPHTVFAASQLHAPSTLGIDITFWEALLLDKTLISGQVPEHQKLTHVSVSELPTGSDKCRIFLPGATTTSFDWSPDRLNVYCDKFGRVFDVRIG